MNHPHGRFECLTSPPLGLADAVDMFGSFIPIQNGEGVHALQWQLSALTMPFDKVVRAVRCLRSNQPAENPIAPGTYLNASEAIGVLHWLRHKANCTQELRRLRESPAAEQAVAWAETKRRFACARPTNESVMIAGGTVKWPHEAYTLLIVCMNDDALAHDADLTWLMAPLDRSPVPSAVTWKSLATDMDISDVVALGDALSQGRSVADPTDPSRNIPDDKRRNVLSWLRHTPVCVLELRTLRHMKPATRTLLWEKVTKALAAATTATVSVPGVLTRLAVGDSQLVAACVLQNPIHGNIALSYLMNPISS